MPALWQDETGATLTMTLCERLRDAASKWDWTGAATAALEREAADEIERLRAALQKLADQADNNWTKKLAQEALISG